MTELTLEQVAWKLGELAREGAVRYDAHDMAVMCSQMADAVTAHLSQPQPVAQGEAIGEIRYGEIAGTNPSHDELVAFMADTYMQASYSPRDAAGAILPYPSRVCAGIEAALGHVYPTPTIPTGHRVVPIEFGDDFIDAMCEVVCVEAGESFSKLDNFTKGCLRDTQRKALLAAITVAAPDAGGV